MKLVQKSAYFYNKIVLCEQSFNFDIESISTKSNYNRYYIHFLVQFNKNYELTP